MLCLCCAKPEFLSKACILLVIYLLCILEAIFSITPAEKIHAKTKYTIRSIKFMYFFCTDYHIIEYGAQSMYIEQEDSLATETWGELSYLYMLDSIFQTLVP